ncbi:hypothetical protein GCM10026982_43210 [Nocardiopsis aegyptia]
MTYGAGSFPGPSGRGEAFGRDVREKGGGPARDLLVRSACPTPHNRLSADPITGVMGDNSAGGACFAGGRRATVRAQRRALDARGTAAPPSRTDTATGTDPAQPPARPTSPGTDLAVATPDRAAASRPRTDPRW